jgi:plasmid stability protein
MATIQIRDVPEDTYEVIRKRARSAGQSIKAYMREQVITQASRRTKAEAFAAVDAERRAHDSRGTTMDEVVDIIRELRGRGSSSEAVV